ncbi:hypothetical protein [Cognaticolwellia beringensis]|uniref:Sugar transporter n=1 Tax=Cognaticolwellia beringensis TaxID=1967665 RepID=A0A222G9W0_9GAMM|nr:hypothetical protein [Cognaticolwellia beringensis]ASP48676.1 hypothetical protein B5D82_13395 [Cognaticolwellia beringensis]
MSENTQTSDVNGIPSWFRVAAILAIVWNLLGVMAFVGHMMMTPEMIAELPQAEQALYTSVPLWATIAFAFAVFGGALGSLALLMKISLCYPLFIASFVGVVVQMFHSFFISNSYEVYGPGGTIMPIMVLLIALVLVRFAAKGKKNNWFS